MAKNKKFNFIYETLVETDEDFVGMVAYAIYKKDKVNYISSVKKRFGGQITDKDIETFNVSSKNKSEEYRKQAKILVKEFIQEIVDSNNEITLDTIEKIIKNKFNSNDSVSWFRSIIQNLIANVLWFIIVFATLFIMWFYSSGKSENITKNIKSTIKTHFEKDTIK